MTDETNIQNSTEGQQEQPPAPVKQEVAKQASGPVPEAGANVKLAHGMKPFAVDGVISIGKEYVIPVPSEAQQRAGFKVDIPSILVGQFPKIYKPIVPKGDKAQTQEDNK